MVQTLEHDWYPGTLPENVRIGSESWLYSSYAFLHYQSKRKTGVEIGSASGIYDGTFFDLGPNGSLTIGDHTTVVGAIFRTDGHISIGDYCLIAHEVVLSDQHCGVPAREAIAMANPHSQAGIRLANNCWIATGAILLDGADIGENTIIGAHTVVDFAVGPNKIVVGSPARILDQHPRA